MNDDNHLVAKIGQYAVIKNPEGKVLVLERARSHTWCLPGGRLNQNEDWQSALVREVSEELNLEAISVAPLTVNVLTDQWQTKYCVYFYVGIKELSVLTLSAEHAGYKWADMGMMNELQFEDDKVREVVMRALTEG